MAMTELYITYTEHRSKYGKQTPSIPSGFLEEIPESASNKLDRFEELAPEQEKTCMKKLYDNLMAKLG